MNIGRVERILTKMREQEIPQMIVSDPVAIYYLTERWIFPGERMLALILNVNGNHQMMINKLFPQQGEMGVNITYYDDVEEPVEIMTQFLEADKVIGIDKTWPSHFLIKLQELGCGTKYVNGSPIVDKVRQIKDEEEKEKLRISSQINDKVMEELIPYVVKGLSEKELNQVVRELYTKHGCEGVSFDPITAYNKNAADPHHLTDDSKGRRGDCIILDIGGFKNCYASDMTRTVFLGEVSDRAKEVYEIVKEAQRRGIEAAKPGNKMKDVDAACRDYITEKGFGEYFTHRTGHSCGLEDHEWGDVSSVNEAVIQPGQCFSIEPGIYLYDEEIGVRIEDLVLITEDGCEVLNSYTKELIVVPYKD